jgi:hypothetical protein
MDQTDSPRASIPSALRIGGMAKSQLLAALREHNIQLNEAAEVLFADRRFTTRGDEHVVAIAALSVAELGFTDGATYGEIVRRALDAGLAECPLEVGPHLRLKFRDQPDSADGRPLTHGRAPPGSLLVASTPLDARDETPKGFYLRHVDRVLWLRGYWSSPEHILSAGDVLVFSKGSAAYGSCGGRTPFLR